MFCFFYGVAHRIAVQRKDMEVVESVTAPEKPEPKKVVKKLFCLQV